MEASKLRAKQTIQTSWQQIASTYTLGWGGPIESVEQQFPFIREAILNIRHQIANDLPVLFFQTRESRPKDMIAAVPFWRDKGNPFNCRLATVRTLFGNPCRTRPLLGQRSPTACLFSQCRPLHTRNHE